MFVTIAAAVIALTGAEQKIWCGYPPQYQSQHIIRFDCRVVRNGEGVRFTEVIEISMDGTRRTPVALPIPEDPVNAHYLQSLARSIRIKGNSASLHVFIHNGTAKVSPIAKRRNP